MKILTFETEQEWMAARAGKITGTRLKDIIVKRGAEKKKGFYEIIAERITKPESDDLFDGDPVGENKMERGKRLEIKAVERFSSETGKTVDASLYLWVREDNENIALSPDGVISDTEAIEVKCLNSASHIEAYLTQKIPSEYELQALQYFIVNDRLKTLYFCFYDPRLSFKDFFYLKIHRADFIQEIEDYFVYQAKELKEIDDIVLSLTSGPSHLGACPDKDGNYCSKECADLDVEDMSGATDLPGFANDR